MRMWVHSLASLSGLRIQGCCEPWCRSQTWLESGLVVAVAVAGSCSSSSTPSLENSICCMFNPKKDKKKTKPQKIICYGNERINKHIKSSFHKPIVSAKLTVYQCS